MITQQRMVLEKIFTSVYGFSFEVTNLEHRIMLQQVVYLLGRLGIRVGDYAFFWNEFSPYCPELSDDMKGESSDCDSDLQFTKEAQETLRKLRVSLNRNSVYSKKDWAVAISSIDYRNNFIDLSSAELQEKAVDNMKLNREVLFDREENIRAMNELIRLKQERV